jgi:hypothetical protein
MLSFFYKFCLDFEIEFKKKKRKEEGVNNNRFNRSFDYDDRQNAVECYNNICLYKF